MKSKEIYRKIYEFVIWEIYGLRCSGDISSTDFYLEAKNNKLIYGVNDCGSYKFEDENLNDKYLKSEYSGKERLSYIELSRRTGVLSLMFARQELKKAMSTGSSLDIDDCLMAINTSGDCFGSAALLEGIEQIFRSKGETRLGYRDELLKEIFATINRGRKFNKKGSRQPKENALKAAMEQRACEVYEESGVLPTADQLWKSLEYDYPECIQEIDNDQLYWKSKNGKEKITGLKSFKNRYSLYKKSLKKNIPSFD